MKEKRIKNALISVFDKTGLDSIVKKLNDLGVTIYSTGGTEKFINDLGVSVEKVEDLTGYPSILGGRVKTLHPKVFGGILNRRENFDDQNQIAEYEIPNLDLVIVDLYPFSDTVKSGGTHDEIIEKIDIGGISLIRAAAKNYQDVVIIPSKNQYDLFLNILNENQGSTLLEQRKYFSSKAFQVSSSYDRSIFEYFTGNQNFELDLDLSKNQILRYGENPHQNGVFHGDLELFFEKLNGKELSYNNLLDVDAAVQYMSDFDNTTPTFCILKHNNACGFASRPSILEAYKAALAGDPVSAFGGILISNTKIDKATALEMNSLFFEVIIAPSYENEAVEVLMEKKNRIILIQKTNDLPKKQYRSILNGILEQDKDCLAENIQDLKVVTKTSPSKNELNDLIFANKLAKHTKSNTIVLVKDQQLLASGTGQTSRVDALKQAIHKAKTFQFDLNGAVMASDAFFPFPDCVEIAHLEGISAVIQPGGSIKDDLSIEYCNNNNVSMVITGNRHFKH